MVEVGAVALAVPAFLPSGVMAAREHARITVGTAPGPRSGRWQIDTSDDDVYVTHEGLRNHIKTSLHASGQNHHKMSESGADRWLSAGSDRITMKWGEPEEFAPGGRILLEIVIPTDQLMVPHEEPPLRKREGTALLDPAPPGEATVLSFALIKPGTTVRSPTGLPSALVASLSLPTRGALVIVATHQPYVELKQAVDAATPEMSAQFAEHVEGRGRPLPIGDQMRAVLWTDLGDASFPHIVEVAVEVRSGRSPYGRRRGPLTRLRRRLART
jgi:hypothetical protein